MDSYGTGPQSDYKRLELLRSSPPPAERADAARNRAAVLDAAARLFREHGVDGVSMDAIAAEAGVGKGTLFRRFGDKAGLAVALLDARERELQEAILFGPAPLGPNGKTTAARRLEAFVSAYLDYALAHLDLARMSETASAGNRYRLGAYRFWHQHVALLLADHSPDPESDAHTLLAPLAAEHLRAVLAETGEKRLRKSMLRNAASYVEYPQPRRA
ncbi:TetR/AcrR family transcriptional regulator [Allorhizocola rhizosphaerae]|uniref:TetR/AcrR family transcriptional regulator n=1 Tax=Allorhizocola rhizosphaerae TaxID=1872709 RepID=UPI000E3CCDDF|nr:TetR/AcrR family transcriptional regulator [Allorhizocola rhizosphaerae]